MQGKVLLVILDGWGHSAKQEGNAIALTPTPNMDYLTTHFPHGLLDASGEGVGLPPGKMGNSEVGHLNIGAGRIIYQSLSRINRAIQDGSFFENPAFLQVIEHVRQRQGRLHLMGLASKSGVHSTLEHCYALLQLCQQRDFSPVFVHAFTDGRDSSPTSGLGFITDMETQMQMIGCGQIATVSGRYFAMDRDRRWDRTQRAYEALVLGHGLRADSARQAVEAAYQRGETDEFIQPTVIEPAGTLRDGDGVIFFNFRPDRACQITEALLDPAFSEFARASRPAIEMAGMALYKAELNLPVAFPPQPLVHILADVLNSQGIPQFRCAETEKFRHVTSFFNGSILEPFSLETRQLIDSPKVATYDLQPEMSAREVTATAIEALHSRKYPVVIMNLANADMVGHTGNLAATKAAVRVVDECIGELFKACREENYILVITADHGNAEEMLDEHGQICTSHSLNPVPLICANAAAPFQLRPGGNLGDVAPTLLELVKMEQPLEMTGRSLII